MRRRRSSLIRLCEAEQPRAGGKGEQAAEHRSIPPLRKRNERERERERERDTEVERERQREGEHRNIESEWERERERCTKIHTPTITPQEDIPVAK